VVKTKNKAGEKRVRSAKERSGKKEKFSLSRKNRKKISDSERYQRQIRFREIGPAAQEELAKKKVAVVGLGATGSLVAQILARAGVGFLRLIDRDFVDIANLQSQFYKESQVGMPKAAAAEEAVAESNSSVKVEPIVSHLDAENVVSLLADVDLILDCTDNMETRYLINDFSLARKIPWIYAASISSIGVVLPITTKDDWACFRCLFPKEPEPQSIEKVEQIGILASAAAVTAAVQSLEALKFLIGKLENQELSYFNVWTGETSRLGVAKMRDCPACVEGKYDYLGEKGKRPIVSCGLNAWHIKGRAVDFSAFKEKLRQVGEVKARDGVLHFKSPEFEVSVFKDGRAIVRNADSAERAAEIYSRVVG